MTKKELYTCDICQQIIAAKKTLCNVKKAILNVLKSQILNTMHILDFHIKLKWSFQMEQSVDISNETWRY